MRHMADMNGNTQAWSIVDPGSARQGFSALSRLGGKFFYLLFAAIKKYRRLG